jgi:organic hydroperoxide reductase OsmC/OhrA
MTEMHDVTIRLHQLEGYRFEVDWGLPPLHNAVLDEPPPTGSGKGPNPSRLVAAAVAQCLCSSLLLCIEKSRGKCEDLEAAATVQIQRNEKGRWRISKIIVTLDPRVPAEHGDILERCKGIFEDYCIATESVRKGIEVKVEWASHDPP